MGVDTEIYARTKEECWQGINVGGLRYYDFDYECGRWPTILKIWDENRGANREVCYVSENQGVGVEDYNDCEPTETPLSHMVEITLWWLLYGDAPFFSEEMPNPSIPMPSPDVKNLVETTVADFMQNLDELKSKRLEARNE